MALLYGKVRVFPSHLHPLFHRAMFWGSRRWWRDWWCCRGGRVPVGAVWEGPWSPGGLVMLQASSHGGPVMLQASSHEQQAVFRGCVCPFTATWPSGPISTQAQIPRAASAEPPGEMGTCGNPSFSRPKEDVILLCDISGPRICPLLPPTARASHGISHGSSTPDYCFYF